jgi:hypothetical protein
MNYYRIIETDLRAWRLEKRPDRRAATPWTVVDTFPTLALAKAAEVAAVKREIADRRERERTP